MGESEKGTPARNSNERQAGSRNAGRSTAFNVESSTLFTLAAGAIGLGITIMESEKAAAAVAAAPAHPDSSSDASDTSTTDVHATVPESDVIAGDHAVSASIPAAVPAQDAALQTVDVASIDAAANIEAHTVADAANDVAGTDTEAALQMAATSDLGHETVRVVGSSGGSITGDVHIPTLNVDQPLTGVVDTAHNAVSIYRICLMTRRPIYPIPLAASRMRLTIR